MIRVTTKVLLGLVGTAALSSALTAGAVGTAVAGRAKAAASRSTLRPVVNLTRSGIRNTWTSSNWSGYAISGKYTAITGTWKIPTVKSTSGTKFSAQWIGIDGFKDQSLIQTGSEADAIGGSAQYGVWWEILPAPETVINEPVRPGQTITASIVKQASGKWVIKISNGSWTFTTTKSYTGPGTSAEWIVEAPQVGGTVASIAHTSPVTFTKLTANGANPKLVAADAGKLKQNGKIVESPSLPSAAGNSFRMQYGPKAPKAP